MRPDQRPARPLWATAILVSIGVVGAPLGILGVALGIDRGGGSGRTSILLAYFGFLVFSGVLSAWRPVRPLGVGMVVGSLALALVFFATGGISTDMGVVDHAPQVLFGRK